MAQIDFSKTVTEEQFFQDIRQALSGSAKQVVVDVDDLAEGLSRLCLIVQSETETRVMRRMLQGTLN